MTEETENLTLRHLQALRIEIDKITEWMPRVDLRLSSIEQTLGNLYALSGSDRESMQRLTQRVERIERRLDLREDS